MIEFEAQRALGQARIAAIRDFPRIPDLERELHLLIRQVPRGRVAACGRLAEALGDVAASRWVGHVLLHHEHDDACPCHRIVRAGGELGGYVSGESRAKSTLLEREGIRVTDGCVPMDDVGFDGFTTSPPLEALQRWQKALAAHVEPCFTQPPPRTIGGLDVSYRTDDVALAACAVIDANDGRLLDQFTATVAAPMPYIPGYLAFRELPALAAVVESAKSAGANIDLWMVDGAGLLHPRRMGIARTLGLLIGEPTIGVTKKLLCGRVADHSEGDSWLPIRDGDATIGAALPGRFRSRKPLYVSIGSGLPLEQAISITQSTLRGHRLPEPIHWADRLSRAAANAQRIDQGLIDIHCCEFLPIKNPT